MSNERLQGRDYIVAIDKSGSMSTPHKGGKTRFQYAQEQTEAVARKCAEFDPNGIDVVVFNNSVKEYNNVSPEKVSQVFAENEPSGGTATDAALRLILDGYFARKAAGTANPITVVVVTDGAPNDQNAVANVIIEATKKMDADEEIGITFLQVGDDAGARSFLQFLDDELQNKGAKFDIVDTKNEAEMDNLSISDLLLAAVED